MRADGMMRQPSAAETRAVARPIPRLAPVMRTTLPRSRKSIARLPRSVKPNVIGAWPVGPVRTRTIPGALAPNTAKESQGVASVKSTL